MLLFEERKLFFKVELTLEAILIDFKAECQNNQSHDNSKREEGIRDEVEAHQSSQKETMTTSPAFGTSEAVFP